MPKPKLPTPPGSLRVLQRTRTNLFSLLYNNLTVNEWIERGRTAEEKAAALKALEHGARDTLSGRNAATAIREWLGEKKA